MRRGRNSRTKRVMRRSMKITYFMLRTAKVKNVPGESLEFLSGDPVQFVNSDTVELT
jgi:hypothetical protein